MIDVGHHLAEAQAKELYWYDGLQTIRNSSRIPSSTQDTMHSKCRGPEGYIRDGEKKQTKEKKPLCTKRRWKKDWSRQRRGKMKQKRERESLLEKNIGERARKAEIKTAEKKGASLA